MKYILSKHVHNTKLGNMVNMLEGRAISQRVLDRLKKWAEKHFMEFNKRKWEVLCM